ncbi:MAG TPA: ABC transporter substrate-binding protein [bacterium]|nr:ABC transporter substrate-binding protein [bacterium]
MKDKRNFNLPHRFGNFVALAALVLLLAAGPSSAQTAKGDALSQIVEGARQEGVIDFSGPSSLTPKGAEALITALNKKYNLELRINYVSASSYPAIAGQLVMQATAGQPPTYDVVFQTESTVVPLANRGVLEPVDWTGIFPHINKESIQLKGAALLTDTMFALPAYNTKTVAPKDVPKSWEDFLDPKWKGKIQAPVYIDGWTTLWGQMWGEEKTTEYLKKLQGQNPVLGRFTEIQTRLASGEYPVAIVQLAPFVIEAQQKGAPVAFATEVKPALVMMNLMSVVKKARHPNAAKLFTAFVLTPEGQEVWWTYGKRSSLYVKGSDAEKFSRGKQLLLPDMDFIIKNWEAMSPKFARALGIH